MCDEILRDAAAHAPQEACGLLFGSGDSIVAARSAQNVADDPLTRFEVDPRVLFDAHKAARSGGAAICGCYHSHPNGSAQPSPTDAMRASETGWIWIIVGNGVLKAYRVVVDGKLHSRFDPVEWAAA